MHISEIRLSNVNQIIKTRYDGKKSRFADAIDKNPAYIATWWAKKETQKRNIGHKIAREIETELGLESGWLDRTHTDNSDLETDPYKKILKKLENKQRYKILLKNIALLQQNTLTLDLLNKPVKGELMFLSTDSEAWAIQLIGNNPNMILDKDWGIIIEPNTPLTVNEYLLVTRKNGEIFLRKLTHRDDTEIIVANPVTNEQDRIPWDDIEKAEYCYIGIPPSKIQIED